MTHHRTSAIISAVTLALLAGCANKLSAGSAQGTADGITKAVYNDDIAAVTRQFDPTLAKTVTRAEVGTLSDTLHAHGSYQGLTLLNADISRNEFTFRAGFTKGSANVVLRLDPNGDVAAYRVFFPKTP